MFQSGDLSACILVSRHSAFSLTETHMIILGMQGVQKQERWEDINKLDILAFKSPLFKINFFHKNLAQNL